MQRKLILRFDNLSAADANMYAAELGADLREISDDIQIEKRPQGPGTQDFGATLVLLFGTPVAIALAKGVANFLQRNSGARITIEADGRVVAEHLDKGDAARIAEAFGAAAKKR